MSEYASFETEPQHRLRKPRRWPWLAGALLLLAGITVGAILLLDGQPEPWAADGVESASEFASTAAQERAAEPAATSEPPPALPSPDDFTVEVRVTSEECFGSAGCTVGLQVEPIYQGNIAELEGQQFTVTFQIEGGSDGPITSSFEVNGERVTFTEEFYTSTPALDTELTATVTDVF